MPSAAHDLTLSAIRRTSQRLWNHPTVSADEKRKAAAYYQTHQDDARKLNALNERMAQLITARSPIHQRREAATTATL